MQEMEKIAELGIGFRLRAEDGGRSPLSRFKLFVEANVIGTDNVVMDRRHSWLFGYVHRTKSGVFLHFERDASRNRRVRVYTEYRSKAARLAIRKVEERLAATVAPKHYREVANLESAIEMFEEIHRQLTVYAVMET